MKLTKEESERLTRGMLADAFLSGDFFVKYLLPFVDHDRREAYPDPGKKGWEDKYRQAYARDDVYTKLFQQIKTWADEKQQLTVKSRETEKDINLA